MSRSRRRPSLACLLALVALIGAVLVAPPAWSQARGNAWLSSGSDPVGLHEAVVTQSAKLPTEFVSRLRHERDGILRVMVSVTERTAATEDFVQDSTTWAKWYYDNPRFYGGVTPDQLQRLLESPDVRFVEPDVPLTYFNAESTIDVGARGLAADGPGVWSFDPNGGPFGSLVSNIPGLTADQATGKDITVAITDSGIDRTFRDFGGWDCEHGIYQPCDSRILRAVSTEHLIGGMDPGDFLPTTEAASGHGSHVAGTVAGNGFYARDGAADEATYGADGIPFGVAPQANLVMTKNGDTIWAGLSQFGLEWQLENAEEYNIRVSSNSWGCLGGCSFNGNSATGQLFKNMYEAGILVTFAAGNDGGNESGTSFSGNAQSPYVLGVASYEDDTLRLASSSSRGSDNSLPDAATWTPESEPVNGERRPDLAAPGVGIWSARTLTGGAASGAPRQSTSDLVGGPECCIRNYALMGGTSMATPHIAGAAAIAFSACPTAQPLDVMRALEATASGKVLKSNGSGPAQPFEVGYGALQVRGAIDWLLARDCDSNNSGGSDPDPDPTESPTPDPTPTETTPPPPTATTTYYFHSGTGANTTDKPTGTATFDDELPTFTEPALATDVPGAGNVNPTQLWDPTWTGDVSGTIRELKVDFWAKVPEEEAQTGGVTWRVSVWNEGLETVLPSAAVEGFNPTGATHFTHTFSTMLTNPTDQTSTVPLSLDVSGPISIQIRPNFLNGAGGTILYDAVDFPSGFSVTTGASPSPTPTETASPTPTETASPTPTDDPTEPPPPPAGDCGSYPEVPNDPYFGGEAPAMFEPQQWGPRVIQAPAAWQEPGGTGCGVKVAVLDSGLDIAAPNNGGAHPDFRCDNKVEIAPGAAATGEGTADDIDGHGTHVAGIIGACTNNGVGTMGVAPDATILPFRVFSDDANYDGDGNNNGSDDLADAIRNAADAGAHVINMSLSFGIAPVPGTGLLGSQYEYTNIATVPPEIRAAMRYAQEAGVVVVAAAGNDTTLPICDYPAIAKDVICVGATDPRDVRTWYSNGPNKPQTDGSFGPSVVAPGGTETIAFCDVYQENVFSTYSREHDIAPCSIDIGYQTLNGTSMASPHAAAVAALAYGRLGGDRSAENAQTVINAVLQGAKDLGAPGYDPVFGYGRVDALETVRAIPYVEPTGPTTTTLSFTEGSATGAQHTDEAEIEAQLTDTETGAPVADAEIVFELTGSTGARAFTATTDADGVAAHSFKVVEQPDQYVLTARFTGDEELYVGSADTASFVVDREGSHTALSLEGRGNDRTATATLTDADDETFGLEGKAIEFFADDRSVGTATTNADGDAVLEIPAKDARGSRDFTAVFEGDGYFTGSTGTSRI